MSNEKKQYLLINIQDYYFTNFDIRMKFCYGHCSVYRRNIRKLIHICQLVYCNNFLIHPEYTSCITISIYQ